MCSLHDFDSEEYLLENDYFTVMLSAHKLSYEFYLLDFHKQIPCYFSIYEDKIILQSFESNVLSKWGEPIQNYDILFGVVFRNQKPYIKQVLQFELINNLSINYRNDNWSLKAKLPIFLQRLNLQT